MLCRITNHRTRMPVEIIGEAGTPGAEREWIDAECQFAIKHLKKVCGEPSPEMELEVQWQEHDLGEDLLPPGAQPSDKIPPDETPCSSDEE